MAFGVAMLLPAPASAADATDHLNVQESARPAYLPGKPGEGFRLPPLPAETPPAAAEAGAEQFQIRRVLFRGNAAIANGELEAVAAPYLGRTVDVAALEDLRQKLTRHYVDRGYINSGALPGKGEVDSGTVTFEVIEGRLSALRLRGLNDLHEDYLVRRLKKDGDAALNIDTLRERFQLLLDDPLFERLNARLMPDARLGEAILDIEVLRTRPYQLTAFANNYRAPSVGANAYGLSGWVRNLTGVGDLVEASVQNAATGNEGGRYSLAWHLPLNQTGTQLSIQFDRGRSTVIEEPLRILDIRSRLDSWDVGIGQVFIETLRHKLQLGINRVKRENRTTLLGQPFSFVAGEPDGVTRVSAWRFWQEYAYRSENQVLALRSTFTAAHNNLQDVAGLPPQAMVAQPERQYRIWLGQAQYARQVLQSGAQVILRGNVQRTDSLLAPLDRMSIGGIHTVPDARGA